MSECERSSRSERLVSNRRLLGIGSSMLRSIERELQSVTRFVMDGCSENYARFAALKQKLITTTTPSRWKCVGCASHTIESITE